MLAKKYGTFIADYWKDEKPKELDVWEVKTEQPNESSKTWSILKDIILSFLVFGSLGNNILQWSDFTYLRTNATMRDSKQFALAIHELVQLSIGPLVGSVIDKAGPELPYISGGLLVLLGTIMVAHWKEPTVFVLANIFHGVGSVCINLSTTIIIINMFTTNIRRSKWFGMIMMFVSFGFYLVLRMIDQTLLLLLAPIIFIIGASVYLILYIFKTKEVIDLRLAFIPNYKFFFNPSLMICVGAVYISSMPLMFFVRMVKYYEKDEFVGIDIIPYDTAFLLSICHVLGIAAASQMTEIFSRYKWLTISAGLIVEAVGCMIVPSISSKIMFRLLASSVIFGVGMATTGVILTSACIVETSYPKFHKDIYCWLNTHYNSFIVMSRMVVEFQLHFNEFTGIPLNIGYEAALYMPMTVSLSWYE